MSLTPNRQHHREPAGRAGGKARPPVRWSVWELVLLTMSVFMIASPLLAAGYSLLVPTAAPAKQAVQTVALQRATATPCAPGECPTETPVEAPTAIPTPGEPFPTDDPSPRTPEPTLDPYPAPTGTPTGCGTPEYPAPCTPTPTEAIPATAEPTSTPGPTNTTAPTTEATAAPTSTPGPTTTPSGFRVTKDALGLNGQGIAQISQGDEYLYSIRVDNPVDPAVVVELVDVFNDNIQPVALLGVDNGTCEIVGQTLLCSLTPSTGKIATVVVRVRVVGAAGAQIPNTVQASIPSTNQSTSASAGTVEIDPLPPTPLPGTAVPATPGPTSPPATPGPTSPPATPGPTSPPATPGPTSPPATPGPTSPPAKQPTAKPKPRDPQPDPATPTAVPTIAVLPTLPPGATAVPATAVPPTAVPLPPVKQPTAKPNTPKPTAKPNTPKPTAKPNTPKPTAKPNTPKPTTPPAGRGTQVQATALPTATNAPAPTPGPTLPPVTTPEPGKPSVRFNLASNWGQVFVGDTMEYEITLQNAGIDAGGSSPLMGTPRRVKQEAMESVPTLKDIVIVDELDPAFEIIEATSPGMTVKTDGQKVEATRPTMAGGEQVTVKIKVRARSVAVSGMVLNQATLRHTDTTETIFSNVVAVKIVLRDAPTATPAPTAPPTTTPTPGLTIVGGEPAKTPQEIGTADLPKTSGGIPLTGFVLLGLTMLLHSVRAHRARSRI